MNKKRKIYICICIILVTTIFVHQFFIEKPQFKEAYGVWIGIDATKICLLNDYQTVVIDASLFSKEDIDFLHKSGHIVYSYLNIGSIETFRPYYEDFKKLTLGPYENWPEEYWIDVSAQTWQHYVTDYLAKDLADKGIDGLFLDNADVWYFYPRPEIYDGLKNILNSLQQYHIPILLNGGDTFVSTALASDDLSNLIDGINQETVFTSIDFETNTFQPQKIEQTNYLISYLDTCRKSGLNIYVLEYTADKKLAKQIRKECAKHKYQLYISSSLELD